MDTLKGMIVNAPQVLLIEGGESKFFDYNLYKQDSLNATDLSGLKTSILSKVGLETKRKYQSSLNKNYRLVSIDYYVYQTNDKINWKLSKEKKRTENYELQKATAFYGGRFWTAWFCKDIQVFEGPYKFNGLPGLIFEVYDDKENYHFTLIGERKYNTINTTDFLENSSKRRAIEVSFSKYQNLLLDNYKNPLAQLRQYCMKNNLPFDYTKQDENDMKMLLKQYNNPVEIDTAIKYK